MSEIIFLSEEKVLDLLTWENTLQATETALASVSKKCAVQNPRSFTNIPGTNNRLLTMPGYLKDERFGSLGCKLVTLFPSNVQRKPVPLPTIGANILLFDDNNGILEAVIAGEEITKWRTAAASVVATKYLTKTKKLQTLAILGAGAQGRIHAEAFFKFFQFREIRIWNHNSPRAESLARELNQSLAESRPIFKAVQSNQECVKEADVIVTATFAETPIVELEWLKEGAHINAVGVGITHCSELSKSIYLSSDVYVDHSESARIELKQLLSWGIEFKGEIGGLIVTKEDDLLAMSLSEPNRITVFQSLGMAVEDCAMARMIYDLHAKKMQDAKQCNKS